MSTILIIANKFTPTASGGWLVLVGGNLFPIAVSVLDPACSYGPCHFTLICEGPKKSSMPKVSIAHADT
ncbi:hypothetical protein [Chromohalobacter canadensis]|uniref:hypothetical protein n=1 Tax=Chromohalobacter canadensis TaxID=141389 RepID=UPI0015C8A041|nr:hypothetical protein [Chromohalobacter canadensis]